MIVQLTRKYSAPCYPDRETALRTPALLQSAPERWRHNASACAAMAATSAMLLSACSAPAGKGGGTPTPKAAAVPFFEHGDGRGSFGCSSVAPPAFLSEPEALEIINEAAADAGIVFKATDMEIKGVDLPVTSTLPEQYRNHDKFKNSTLALDGFSEEKQIAYEFITTDDIDTWTEKTDVWCSVSEYDFAGTAKALRQKMDQCGAEMPVAVFYDTKDKEDLRAQVRDFVAWLKAEGVI